MADTPLRSVASDGDLAKAMTDNLQALFRAMAASLPGGEIEESQHSSRHLTFPSNPMFKGVWNTRLAADEVDAAIDANIAWFAGRGAQFFFWWTGPGTAPPDLGERLTARCFLSMEQTSVALAQGMAQTEDGAPVMAADLRQVSDAPLQRTPPGFVIEEVANLSSLQAWKDVVVATYQFPEWAGQAWVDATATIGFGRTPWKLFLGRLDGEPVATNMLFTGGGVASILAVATLPKAQRRGIGAAISLKPLLDARAAGYRFATLWSTEEGLAVYRRIGFHDTGARLNRYLWRNQS